jgi:hypothetical protein
MMNSACWGKRSCSCRAPQVLGRVGQEIGIHAPRENRGSATITLGKNDLVKQDNLRILCIWLCSLALADKFIET